MSLKSGFEKAINIRIGNLYVFFSYALSSKLPFYNVGIIAQSSLVDKLCQNLFVVFPVSSTTERV